MQSQRLTGDAAFASMSKRSKNSARAHPLAVSTSSPPHAERSAETSPARRAAEKVIEDDAHDRRRVRRRVKLLKTSGTGPRPAGRLRLHDPAPVGRWAALSAQPIHRTFLDPDGRPRSLRTSHF